MFNGRIPVVISPAQQRGKTCIHSGDSEQDHCGYIGGLIASNLRNNHSDKFDVFVATPIGDSIKENGKTIGLGDLDRLSRAITETNRWILGKGGKGFHIALHSDAGGPTARGGHTCYHPSSNAERKFAEVLNGRLNDYYKADTGKSVRPISPRTDLGELKMTAIAALIEFAFHTNEDDARWIHEKASRIAQSIVDSMVYIYNNWDETIYKEHGIYRNSNNQVSFGTTVPSNNTAPGSLGTVSGSTFKPGAPSSSKMEKGDNKFYYSSSDSKDYNDVADVLYSHIQKERRQFPPLYTDSIPEIKEGAMYNKLGISNPRDIVNEDYFRIADCVLQVPPESVSVTTQSFGNEFQVIRQKDSLKLKSGYHNREIRIPLIFSTYPQINGVAIPGPNGRTYYIDGLRSLLAQIKKSPFLPVENYLLNVVHNIHAITVAGINIKSVPGYPDLVEGELVCFEFNAQPYLALPTAAMMDCINWDLFRWYYNRSLTPTSGVTYLQPITGAMGDSFKFHLLDDEVLSGNKEVDEDIFTVEDDYMLPVDMPEGVHLLDIQIGYGNIIKNLQLSNHGCPTTQYFGSTSTVISCTFETDNEDVVMTFRNLYETCERYAREYRNRTVQGYIKFDQALVQLFGVTHVMIEALKIDTVPGFPGSYTIFMMATSFDKDQSSVEKPRSFSPVNSEGTIDDLLNNSIKNKWQQTIQDQTVEDMLDQLDLYPDLELPTYIEANNAIDDINSWRRNNGLDTLPYAELESDNSSFKVDPDFYYCYPSLKTAGLVDYVDDVTDLNQHAGKMNELIANGITGGQYTKATKASGTDTKTNYNGNNSITPNNMSYSAGSADLNAIYEMPFQSACGVSASVLESFIVSKIPNGKYGGSNRSVPRNTHDLTRSVWFTPQGKLLPGIGQAFLDAERKYNLNAVFLMCLAGHESAWGSSFAAQEFYNFYGADLYDSLMDDIYRNGVSSKHKGADKKHDIKSMSSSKSVPECITLGALRVQEHTTRVNEVHYGGSKDPKHQNRMKVGQLKGYATDANHNNAVAKLMANFYSLYPTYTKPNTGVSNTASSTTAISPLKGIPVGSLSVIRNFEYVSTPKRLTTNSISAPGSTPQAITFHNGVDFDTPNDIDVVAILDGTVKDVYDNSNYGKWVVIDHGNGLVAKYDWMKSKANLSKGDKVKQGQVIGTAGTATPTNMIGWLTEADNKHLHLELTDNGKQINPLTYLRTGKKEQFSAAQEISKENTNYVDLGDQPKTKQIPGINYNLFGKPYVQRIKEAGADGIVSGQDKIRYPNTEEGLLERMAVDMVEFNRRGTMCRAFPSYVMLFVDEGMWMDGRRLWSNYYAYHAVVDITIERDRRKPADTAVVKLTNIYNSLGTNPKAYYGEYNWFQEKILKSLNWYTNDMLNTMINNKNRMLQGFNIKTGARIHLRLGYGNQASKMPVTFNGIITEVDTSDVMTFIAQSDGLELTLVPIGQDDPEETNSDVPLFGNWTLGCEPQNIITRIMSQRTNGFLSKISGGRLSETSKYGIEHFGNCYFKSVNDVYVENANKWIPDFLKGDKLKNTFLSEEAKRNPDGNAQSKWDTIVKSGVLDPKQWLWASNFPMAVAENLILTSVLKAHCIVGAATAAEFVFGLLPGNEENLIENYDIVKNIYIANSSWKDTGYEKDNKVWFMDGEDNIKIYLYNRTPWDAFQVISNTVPGFICQPHTHQFRSTLFFGSPYWNCRYKYKVNNDGSIDQYAKPFSQLHLIGSLHDIIDNSVKAVRPAYTAAIPTYTLGDDKESVGTIYADRNIKSELQKTVTVDSTTKWDILGPDKLYKMFGYDPGGEIARNIGISGIQDSFKDMYEGSIVILGDAAIKPFDTIYLDDMYIGMGGTCQVGRVVHHMSVETGFVTDIKPDLMTMNVESNVMWEHMIVRGAASIAAGWVLYARYAAISANTMQIARNALTVAKSSTIIKGTISKLKGAELTVKAARTMTGIRKTISGLKTTTNVVKGLRTGIAAMGVAGAPATLGTSLVVAAIGLVVTQIIDSLARGIINYFRNSNVIKIYPLFYRDKPYVAGINGHKDLIPGLQDEDIYLNYDADEVGMAVKKRQEQVATTLAPSETQNYLDQAKERTALTPQEKRIQELTAYINKLRSEDKAFDKAYREAGKTKPQLNPKKPNTGTANTYRPVRASISRYKKGTDRVYGEADGMGTLQNVYAFAAGIVVDCGVETWELKGKDNASLIERLATGLRNEWTMLSRTWNGDRIYSTMIAIEHAIPQSDGSVQKLISIYSKLKVPLVTMGQEIKEGQVIGLAGGSHYWGLPGSIKVETDDIEFQLASGKTAVDYTKYFDEKYKDETVQPPKPKAKEEEKGFWEGAGEAALDTFVDILKLGGM